MPSWPVLVHNLGTSAISIGNERITGTRLQHIEQAGFGIALLDDHCLGQDLKGSHTQEDFLTSGGCKLLEQHVPYEAGKFHDMWSFTGMVPWKVAAYL